MNHRIQIILVLALLSAFLFTLNSAPVSAKAEGIGAIGWNGEYWLIGTFDGEVVKYDGEEFTRIGALDERILEVESTEDFWLIDGWHTLVKYDGKALTKIGDYDVGKTSCNPSYCLIYAKLKGEELSEEAAIAKKKEFVQMSEGEKKKFKEELLSMDRLFRYDGRAMIDLSENVEFPIREMRWNGAYWLIGTTNLEGDSGLYKFDGGEITPIELQTKEIPKEAYHLESISWEGDFWLIAVAEGVNSTLYKYDGESFEQVFSSQNKVQSVVCNSEFCLIFLDNNDIIKFDGSRFEMINESFESGKILYALRNVKWDGDYWLISYTIANEGGSIAKYDGENFTELTEMPSNCFEGGMEWNDKYWLIGTFQINCNRWALLKYDGLTFTDLTREFEGVASSTVPLEPPWSTPPSLPGYFHTVFLGLLLLELILLSILLWKIREKRGVFYGAVWGLIGLTVHVMLEGAKLMRGYAWIIEIIALPSVIWSKIAYQLGGGGTFYYSPLIVLPVSVAIGAVIGYGIEKGYQKVKGKR